MIKESLWDTLLQTTKSIIFYLSHSWFATVQEVLQADWQEVWHSPHPPFAALCFKVAWDKVFPFSTPPFLIVSYWLYHKTTLI